MCGTLPKSSDDENPFQVTIAKTLSKWSRSIRSNIAQEHAYKNMDPGIVQHYLAVLCMRTFALDVFMILFGINFMIKGKMDNRLIHRLLMVDGHPLA